MKYWDGFYHPFRRPCELDDFHVKTLIIGKNSRKWTILVVIWSILTSQFNFILNDLGQIAWPPPLWVIHNLKFPYKNTLNRSYPLSWGSGYFMSALKISDFLCSCHPYVFSVLLRTPLSEKIEYFVVTMICDYLKIFTQQSAQLNQ